MPLGGVDRRRPRQAPRRRNCVLHTRSIELPPLMKSSEHISASYGIWIAAIAAVVIFLVDLTLPLGVAIPIAYVGLILFGLWIPQMGYTVGIAALASVLTVIDPFLSSPGGPVWMAAANRGIVIAVLWSTAVIVILYNHARREIRALRGMLAICASCKKVRGDEGFWKHMDEYIEDHSEVLLSHCLCPACQQKWFPELAERRSSVGPAKVTESSSL